MRTILAVLLATLFLILVQPGPARAGENRTLLRMDPVEVVSTPVIEGNRVDRYGSLSTEVSESQIEDLNAQDLANALRMSPGVTISRYNKIGSFGGGEGGAVFIRGLGSGRPGSEIKTFIDGVPMYMGVWNHPLLDLLSVDPARRIEVHKGPQPQRFGNVFGAVNIVPKKKSRPGYTTKLHAAGGSYETFVQTVEHGGKTGPFDYYAGQGFRTSDGHRDDSGGTMRSAFSRVGYELNEAWSASVFGLHANNEASDPGAVGREAASEDERYETEALLGIAKLSHNLPGARGEIKIFANRGEGDWLNQQGFADDTLNDFLFYGIKARETLTPWSGGEIIVGADWDYTDGEATFTFDDGSRSEWDGHSYALFSPHAAVSHRFEPSEDLYVVPSAGLRYYEHADFEAEYSPHAGIVLGYGQTELHAGYSRGVLYPGLEVAVISRSFPNPDGWSDLEAEKLSHFEAGIRRTFARKARVDATFFYDEGRDRYVVQAPPPSFQNVEEYRTRGAELTISLTPLPQLSLFAGLTLLDTDPADMPYAPDSTLSTGLNLRFLEHFKLSLDSQYVNEMHVLAQRRAAGASNPEKVGDRFLVNGKLSYMFSLRAGRISGELFLAGENLTDTDYEYRPGYPMPGINAMAGATLTF
jgi:iron complex outermembrane receptor protein